MKEQLTNQPICSMMPYAERDSTPNEHSNCWSVQQEGPGVWTSKPSVN
jgi:hypothetical protein